MKQTANLLEKLKRHAFDPSVVKRAVVISVVVGTLLVAINHGSRICDGTFFQTSFIQALLTMLVPYIVSTLSSVLAIEDRSFLNKS